MRHSSSKTPPITGWFGLAPDPLSAFLQLPTLSGIHPVMRESSSDRWLVHVIECLLDSKLFDPRLVQRDLGKTLNDFLLSQVTPFPFSNEYALWMSHIGPLERERVVIGLEVGSPLGALLGPALEALAPYGEQYQRALLFWTLRGLNNSVDSYDSWNAFSDYDWRVEAAEDDNIEEQLYSPFSACPFPIQQNDWKAPLPDFQELDLTPLPGHLGDALRLGWRLYGLGLEIRNSSPHIGLTSEDSELLFDNNGEEQIPTAVAYFYENDPTWHYLDDRWRAAQECGTMPTPIACFDLNNSEQIRDAFQLFRTVNQALIVFQSLIDILPSQDMEWTPAKAQQ